MKKLGKYILYALVILYLAIYISTELGYTKYYQYQRTQIVESKIKEFEEKLAKGEKIDISSYVEQGNVEYKNAISNVGLGASNTIETLTKEMFRKLFNLLNNSLDE